MEGRGRGEGGGGGGKSDLAMINGRYDERHYCSSLGFNMRNREAKQQFANILIKPPQ